MIVANVSSGAFLAMCTLLMMATPAYSGQMGGKGIERAAPIGPDTQESIKKQPINIVPMKVGAGNMGAVDLYGDGMLIIAVPQRLGQKEKTTLPEAINSLIPIPTALKLQTIERVGSTIIIKSITPAHDK